MRPAKVICHPLATSGSTCEVPPPRQHRGECPAERRREKRHRGNQLPGAERGGGRQFGPEQQHHPRKAQSDAGECRCRHAVARREEEALDQQEPNGHHGDDERGQPGRQVQLGPREHRVRHPEKQETEQRELQQPIAGPARSCGRSEHRTRAAAGPRSKTARRPGGSGAGARRRRGCRDMSNPRTRTRERRRR